MAVLPAHYQIMNDTKQTGLNARQERFCEELITGTTATEAAKRAGYSEKTAHIAGHRLLRNVKCKARIAALRAVTAQKTGMTVAKVEQMYLDAIGLAYKTNQPSAAISGITGIARLYGYDKDTRVETEQDRQLTEHQKVEARRLAHIRLMEIAS